MAEEIQVSLKVIGLERMKQDLAKGEKSVKEFSSNVNSNLSIKSIATGSLISRGIEKGIGAITSTIQNVADSAVNIVKNAIESASDLQQVALAFEVMLGSAEKAKSLLTDLERFAATTPFNLTELQESTKRLLAYGLAQEEIIPTMRSLGNIAAGVGKDKLPFLITALGQVRAKTILSGEELKQFTEAGVPLIQELSRVTGYSIGTITDQTKDLGITYNQVAKALSNLSADGGKFSGLMDRLSKQTLAGTLSNLEDIRDRFLRTLGGINSAGEIQKGGLLDVLTSQSQKLLEFLDLNKQKISDLGAKLGQSFGTFINEVIPRLMEKLPSLIDQASKFVQSINMTDVSNRAKEFIQTLATIRDILNVTVNVARAAFDLMRLGLESTGIGVEMLVNGWKGLLAQLQGNNTELEILGKRNTDLQKRMEENIKRTESSWNAMRIAIEKTQGSTEGVNNKVKDLQSNISIATSKAENLNNAMIKMSKGGSLNQRELAILHAQGSYANGGIVPRAKNGIIAGSSFSGDKKLIAVNSGEMIINRNDQQALFSFLKQLGSRPQQVVNATFNRTEHRSDSQQLNMFLNMLDNL